MAKSARARIAGEFFAWNLFRRDGVWYADGRNNMPNLGKHSLGTRDREAALRAVHELDRRKAVDQGIVRSLPEGRQGVVSIVDGWRWYLDEHAAAPEVMGGTTEKTRKRYRAVRDKYQKFCLAKGIQSWQEMEKASVVRYGRWLTDQGYGDATLYLECTLLQQVVKWLVEEKKALPESCRIHLPLRRSFETTTHCYTRAQVQAMLDLCRAAPELHWLADVIVALATTGMRIGELADLRWSDVDLDAGVITLADTRHSGKAKKLNAVRTTKGRRSRRVDVHRQLRWVLERLPRRADGRVLGGARGGRIDPDKVLTSLKRNLLGPLKHKFPTPPGEIGFEHAGVHSFRHYFVTEAFAGGASETEVMDWVGHRDSRIVRRYRHLRGNVSRQRMEGLSFFGQAPVGGTTADQPTAADQAASMIK